MDTGVMPRSMTTHRRNVHAQIIDGCPECEELRAYGAEYYRRNIDKQRAASHEKWLRRKAGAPYPRTTESARCPRCRLVRPAEDFASCTTKPNGLQTYCRSCWRGMQDAEKESARKVLRKYGISMDDYRKRLIVCEICGTEEGLVLDHEHETGKLRGALCGPHNMGLGQFGDDIGLLRAAILYLTKYAEDGNG